MQTHNIFELKRAEIRTAVNFTNNILSGAASKQSRVFAILTCFVFAFALQADAAGDDFNRSSEDGALGGDWSVLAGNVAIRDEEAVTNQARAEALAVWNPGSLNVESFTVSCDILLGSGSPTLFSGVAFNV